MLKKQVNISIAGSGKVARSFGLALKVAGHRVGQIIARNSDTGRSLANELGAELTSFESTSNADLIAVLVSDDAIEKVSAQLPINIPQFHASGVSDLDVLSSEIKGVVWPIKSINSRSSGSSFKGVPLGVEGNNEEFQSTLLSIARSIGGDGFVASSENRSIIHLAAVFTDNFANHCLSLSQDILKDSDLDTKLMRSLAQGLLEGALNGDSASRQTGVAIRGDVGSQMKHLGLLSDEKKKEFYKFLSKQIKEYHELQGKT